MPAARDVVTRLALGRALRSDTLRDDVLPSAVSISSAAQAGSAVPALFGRAAQAAVLATVLATSGRG